MSNILCMYYSRTGNTKKAMEEIAQELGAELVELRQSHIIGIVDDHCIDI